MARGKRFKIGGEVVGVGKTAIVRLELPKLYTMRASPEMAVHVINGAKAGPTMFVSAAIHGDELNGVEMVRRLLLELDPKEVSGTLIAIPVVNIFGIVQYSRYLPDGRDLNRSFPGSAKGSMASRLAAVFFDEIVERCDYGIDLHTGGGHRANLPQIRANLGDQETRELAKAFGVPVLIDSNGIKGTLRKAAIDSGVKVLLYEAGAALRFDEVSIVAGVQGIKTVMQLIQMLSGDPEQQAEPYIAKASRWVRSTESGIFHSNVKLGDSVNKGTVVGYICNPSDCFADVRHNIESPLEGVVIGLTRIPLVNEGDALLHLATFDDSEEVADEVDDFHASIVAPGNVSGAFS